MTKNLIHDDTPWGKVVHQVERAEDISYVSTASHGGFVLGNSRAAWLKQHFPDLNPLTGDYHYWEEDCDAPVIVIAFHEYFRDDEVARTREIMPQLPQGAYRLAAIDRGLTKLLAGNETVNSHDKLLEAQKEAAAQIADQQKLHMTAALNNKELRAFIVSITDAAGPYSELDGHRIVQDARNIIAKMAGLCTLPTDDQMRCAARILHSGVDIDDTAKVTRGDEEGAYVAAWVWVRDGDAEE